jgi:hypothetical protein
VKNSNDDSDIQSVTGRSKGLLADCTPIMITRYEWSKTDREYYVYVKAGGVEGWVIPHLVSLGESNP